MELINEIKNFSDEIKDSFLDYAMSVIVSRALPDVKDGLKPVHRRIIYAMNQLKITHRSQYKKSARIVGEVIGKYHPHGDSSVYQAMVRMAQEFSYRYPLIDGHGNFGSIDGDSPAAMRYTEARMSKIAFELIKDIEKDTVNIVNNYDDTEKEPAYLTSYIPNILLNGANGIAVGMATNIAPHQLGEVVDSIIYYINNKECETRDLLNFIKGPDFPTGGIVYGGNDFLDIYNTGRGSIKIRSKYHLEKTKKQIKIVFTEIPYQVNKSKLLEKIANLVKEKKIKDIVGLRDESNRKGIRIVLDIRKNIHEVDYIINKLFKLTQLQTNFPFNMVALINNQPKLVNLKTILKNYIEHQIQILIKKTNYQINILENKLNILEGILIAIENIDDIIKIIKNSENNKEALESLKIKYNLNDTQNKAILDMKLNRLTSFESDKIKKEIANIKNELNGLYKIIKNEQNEQNKTIINNLKEIKEKYNDKRRTEISSTNIGSLEDESLIKNENKIIILSENDYIKRLNPSEFKIQKRGGKGVIGFNNKNQKDEIKIILKSKTLDTLIFFTNLGNVYSERTYKIKDSSRSSKGIPLVNLIDLKNDEYIQQIISYNKEEEKNKFLLFATEKGILKRTKIEEYSNINKNGKKGIILRENDKINNVLIVEENDKVMIVNSYGKTIKLEVKKIRTCARTSIGVKGINNIGKYKTIGLIKVNEDDFILTITEKGKGKKTPTEEFAIKSRGGKGMLTHKLTDSTGKLIIARSINDNNNFNLIISTKKGQIIKIESKDITTSSRATQGNILLRLNKDDSVVKAIISPIIKED